MAFITVSGEPGCRHEELARMTAQRFECELVTEPDLASGDSPGPNSRTANVNIAPDYRKWALPVSNELWAVSNNQLSLDPSGPP